ncbi:N-acetyltransferase family protein [Eggerthellaceae bacterium 3-80]|nr:N-acetyltransferase [bacterium D16-34]
MTHPATDQKATLRFATELDMKEIARIYALYIDTPITFDEQPLSAQDFLVRFSQTKKLFPWLVIEQKDECGTHLLGYAYAHPQHERAAYRWNAETSIYLDPHATGRGFGTLLYDTLLNLLRLLGYKMAYALVTLPNPASEQLHRACGFHLFGTQVYAGYTCGAWRDVAWLTKQLGSFEGTPQTPQSLEILAKQSPLHIKALLDEANARIN